MLHCVAPDIHTSYCQEVAAASGAGSDSILRLQYNKMRETLLCGICKERYKDTCIAKCFHTFCSECVLPCADFGFCSNCSARCVSSRLGSRNRKCPQCSASFSDNQVTAGIAQSSPLASHLSPSAQVHQLWAGWGN